MFKSKVFSLEIVMVVSSASKGVISLANLQVDFEVSSKHTFKSAYVVTSLALTLLIKIKKSVNPKEINFKFFSFLLLV